ncbi:MAG: hypothetical protein U1F65_06680 [Verrucomicrobiota bacterium]
MADVLVLIGSAWLVARFRARGVVFSILVGWGILAAVYWYFPAPPDSLGGWDEDHEEVPRMGWLLMFMWCMLVYILANIWPLFKKPQNRVD